jgi:hypothetical protein
MWTIFRILGQYKCLTYDDLATLPGYNLTFYSYSERLYKVTLSDRISGIKEINR